MPSGSCQASSSNSGSARASARPGPEAIAKNFSCSSFQPAYCDARHAAAGRSTETVTPGQVRSPTTTGAGSTRPSPPMQTDANTSPAFSPPRAWAPQSITRAPESSVATVAWVMSGSAATASASPAIRWFMDTAH